MTQTRLTGKGVIKFIDSEFLNKFGFNLKLFTEKESCIILQDGYAHCSFFDNIGSFSIALEHIVVIWSGDPYDFSMINKELSNAGM